MSIFLGAVVDLAVVAVELDDDREVGPHLSRVFATISRTISTLLHRAAIAIVRRLV
jgi:hypothetical protein